MSDLGMGAMLHLLGGGSEHSSDEYIGKTISKAELANNRLNIDFDDGVRISIYDDAQSCCEQRYMTTDDDVSWLAGKKFRHAMIKSAPNMQDEYGEHEVQFLEIMTDDGCVTFANHNEHDGYYGGFGITIVELD